MSCCCPVKCSGEGSANGEDWDVVGAVLEAHAAVGEQDARIAEIERQIAEMNKPKPVEESGPDGGGETHGQEH